MAGTWEGVASGNRIQVHPRSALATAHPLGSYAGGICDPGRVRFGRAGAAVRDHPRGDPASGADRRAFRGGGAGYRVRPGAGGGRRVSRAAIHGRGGGGDRGGRAVDVPVRGGAGGVVRDQGDCGEHRAGAGGAGAVGVITGTQFVMRRLNGCRLWPPHETVVLPLHTVFRVSLVTEKVDVLAAACSALVAGSDSEARRLIQDEYPFAPVATTKRLYGPSESTRVWLRDGFIDRYSGARLVFPPALRLLSEIMPEEFPFHPNWKTDSTHSSYWELAASIDHLVPVTRGGSDAGDNWVTTTMARNSAKGNWSLEELGWSLRPPGDFSEWDGLFSWFLAYPIGRTDILSHQYFRLWHRIASACRPLKESRR